MGRREDWVGVPRGGGRGVEDGERLWAREGMLVAFGTGRRTECQSPKADPSESEVTGCTG